MSLDTKRDIHQEPAWGRKMVNGTVNMSLGGMKQTFFVWVNNNTEKFSSLFNFILNVKSFETRKHSSRMRTARLVDQKEGFPSQHPSSQIPPSWHPHSWHLASYPLMETPLHGTLSFHPLHGTPLSWHSFMAPPCEHNESQTSVKHPLAPNFVCGWWKGIVVDMKIIPRQYSTFSYSYISPICFMQNL